MKSLYGIVTYQTIKDQLSFSVEDELALTRGLYNGQSEYGSYFVRRNKITIDIDLIKRSNMINNSLLLKVKIPDFLDDIIDEKYKTFSTTIDYVLDNFTKFSKVSLPTKLKQEFNEFSCGIRNILFDQEIYSIPIEDTVGSEINLKRPFIHDELKHEFKRHFLIEYASNYWMKINLYPYNPEKSLEEMYKREIRSNAIFLSLPVAGSIGYLYAFKSLYDIAKTTDLDFTAGTIAGIFSTVMALVYCKGFDKLKEYKKYKTKLKELQTIIKEEETI